MNIDKGQGSIYMAFLFNKFQEFSLPNLVVDQGHYVVGSNTEKQALTLLQSELRSYEGGILLIGTYNEGSESIFFNLELELSGIFILVTLMNSIRWK